MSTAIALAIGDVHLSHNVPVARGETREEWYNIQEDYVLQVRNISQSISPFVPILIPGDVCDTWDQPHELTNYFRGKFGPNAFSVAGNHDLPNHNPLMMDRSAYGTFCNNGTLFNLLPACYRDSKWKLELYGMGCGSVSVKPGANEPVYPRIAVIHDYIWGPQESAIPKLRTTNTHFGAWAKRLRGYDLAVFGDNHKTFRSTCFTGETDDSSCEVVNCGTLIRRRSDERKHIPHVAMIYEGMSISWKPLNTSKDKWRKGLDEVESAMVDVSVDDFLETIKKLAMVQFDFREAVNRFVHVHNTRSLVKDIIEEVLAEESR